MAKREIELIIFFVIKFLGVFFSTTEFMGGGAKGGGKSCDHSTGRKIEKDVQC